MLVPSANTAVLIGAESASPHSKPLSYISFTSLLRSSTLRSIRIACGKPRALSATLFRSDGK